MQYEGESLNADHDPATLEGQMRQVQTTPVPAVQPQAPPSSIQTSPLQPVTVQPPPSSVSTTPVQTVPPQEIKKY